MPRPQSAVWQHFSKVDGDRRAVCNFCQHEQSSLVLRMAHHLKKKCRSCPEEIKESIVVNMNQETRSTPVKMVNRQSTSNDANKASQSALKRPRKDNKQMVQTINEKNILDRLLAKSFFTCGFEFVAIEDKSFVELLKKLKPDYEVPSSTQLTTSLLDAEYSALREDVCTSISQSNYVSLSVKSWALMFNKPLISFTVTTPKPMVYDIIDTGETLHSAEFVTQQIDHVIQTISPSKVSSVLLDQSPAMKESRKLLVKRYPNIDFLSCCAYGVNGILMEAFSLPWAHGLLEICKQFCEFLNNSYPAEALIRRIFMEKMGINKFKPLTLDEKPSTRLWMNTLLVLSMFHTNRLAFQFVLLEEAVTCSMEENLKQRLLDGMFWDELTILNNLFYPFLNVLNLFQLDHPMLSSFYHSFNPLWGHVQNTSSPISLDVYDIMQRHWNYIEHPAIYASYLLDPRYRSQHLSSNGMNMAMQYLKNSCTSESYPNVVAEMSTYTGNEGIFSDKGIWDSAQLINPISWWKGFIGNACPHLQQLAIRVLSISCCANVNHIDKETCEKIWVPNGKLNVDCQQQVKALYVHWSLKIQKE